jgi:hypothetical protein
MLEWEYRKLFLNQHAPRGDELDLLNAAGAEGWELVGLSPATTSRTSSVRLKRFLR